MIAQRRGSIVNVASRAGLHGGGAGSAYATSKHALVGLTRSLAARYARDGVRCNAVCPGGVVTGIGATAAPRDPAEHQGWAAVFASMPRAAEPDQIATVVSWLASAEASNLTGAIVAADAGWTAL
jgi:NAD(P)-dependent dehydrogenase (short-subunit alcohol dehydrogenase family)